MLTVCHPPSNPASLFFSGRPERMELDLKVFVVSLRNKRYRCFWRDMGDLGRFQTGWREVGPAGKAEGERMEPVESIKEFGERQQSWP